MIGFTRQNDLDEKRYELLKEVVDGYLGDQGEDPADLIRDIKRACKELKEYHAERLDAYNTVETSINV